MSSAPPFVLTDLDGRAQRLDALCADGDLLLAFVERDCPTSTATLRTLSTTGARVAAISQGTAPAAQALAGELRGDVTVLVETAPYPVSTAYEVQTLPTLVLVETGGLAVGRVEGWDRAALAPLVAAAGGRADGFGEGLPDTKPGCQSRSTYDADTQATLEREDAALGGDDIEEMWRRGWTDGLPVVPPTRERVRAMLGDRDPDESLGPVPPVNGELTLERLAACAVLAGCAPAYFPVVRAAVEAALDPAFNLHGMQNTTHFGAPVVIVNGPVRTELAMNAGSNVLGFGNRANATIGRALRLVLALTGGGTAGGLDMSTLGGPHKFGLCFPEREEASPWEPLHVELGHDASTSTVTVICGESPAGVSDHYSQNAEGVATSLTLALERAWAPTWYPVGAETLLVVSPEHAATFAAAGWSKATLRQWLFSRARATAGALRASGSGELTPFVALADSDQTEIPKFLSPEEIVIVVAGGDAGRFSAVIGPWVGFGLGSKMVTRAIN
jgi:hypothetical protein